MARLQVFFAGLNSAAFANQTVPGGSKTSIHLSLYKPNGVLLKGHIHVQQIKILLNEENKLRLIQLMQSINKTDLNQNELFTTALMNLCVFVIWNEFKQQSKC